MKSPGEQLGRLRLGAGGLVRLESAGVADGGGVLAAPGSVLLRVGENLVEILAAGSPDLVAAHDAAGDAPVVSLPSAVLIPALVNAHTHLDLTHVGPRPFDAAAGFAGWLGMVMRERAADADAVRASMREGLRRLAASGVAAVGDIAGDGREEATAEFLASPMLGVSFVEVFGMGSRAPGAAQRVAEIARADGGRGRVGVSPHAPYSAGAAVFDAIPTDGGLRWCTHLAESVEEREFVAAGRGPIRAFVDRLGLWEDAALEGIGEGLHPMERLAPTLERVGRRALLAHVNDCPDWAVGALAKWGASVAFCPRGHAYFGREAEVGQHRYREMLEAGVNVCLGTDSVINLPAEGSDLSPLEEARFLWRREGGEARTLLRMATSNGAAALGLEPGLFDLSPGRKAGLVAVAVGEERPRDPAAAVLAASGPARFVCRPGREGAEWA